MNNIKPREINTKRLDLRIPTMDEQYRLWEILKDEEVNKYYFPTPDRIFNKYNLDKTNIDDLKEARKIFIEQFSDWERQEVFYQKKIDDIHNLEKNPIYVWSIFLKGTDTIIGQVSCQNGEDEDKPSVRDVGWYIDPKYQGNGFASEAAKAMIDFMFNEVDITDIYTSAAAINPASWKIMDKLGFKYLGLKKSTYYKENEILDARCYHINKDMFNSKED